MFFGFATHPSIGWAIVDLPCRDWKCWRSETPPRRGDSGCCREGVFAIVALLRIRSLACGEGRRGLPNLCPTWDMFLVRSRKGDSSWLLQFDVWYPWRTD